MRFSHCSHSRGIEDICKSYSSNNISTSRTIGTRILLIIIICYYSRRYFVSNKKIIEQTEDKNLILYYQMNVFRQRWPVSCCYSILGTFILYTYTMIC